MLRSTIHKKKGSQNIVNEFMKILTRGKKDELHTLVQELAKRDNPTLVSILKIEDLFKKHIEFDSRSQLLRKLDGCMKASSLNTIIARLVDENKIIVNDDHSLTWIDTKANKKLNKQFDSAIPL